MITNLFFGVNNQGVRRSEIPQLPPPTGVTPNPTPEWGNISVAGSGDSPVVVWTQSQILGIDDTITLRFESDVPIPGNDSGRGLACRISSTQFTDWDEFYLGYGFEGNTQIVSDGEWVQLWVRAPDSTNASGVLSIINQSANDIVLDEIQWSVDTGSPCYLTTAMVQYMGMDDDCIELETMRTLRELYKTGTHLSHLIAEYADISPKIIKYVDASEVSAIYYERIYDVLQQVVVYGQSNNWDDAANVYVELYLDLKREFGL